MITGPSFANLLTLLRAWKRLRQFETQLASIDDCMAETVLEVGTETFGVYHGLEVPEVSQLRDQLADGMLKILETEDNRPVPPVPKEEKRWPAVAASPEHAFAVGQQLNRLRDRLIARGSPELIELCDRLRKTLQEIPGLENL